MYKNIGPKIKGLAKAIVIVEAIVSVIIGIALMASDDGLVVSGLLVMLVGPTVAWVSSWVLYGFGELVDKVCNIERNIRGENFDLDEEELLEDNEFNNIITTKEISHKKEETVIPEEYKGIYSCPKCGCTIKKGQKECVCSRQIDWSNYEH